MNLDVIACVLLVVGLTAFFVFWWKVFRGYAGGGWWRVLRIAVSLALALVLVAWGAYWLMNSRTVQLLGDHVSRVETTHKVVALTFDDGPADMYVSELLADLRHYDAHATFYVIGADAKAHPAAMTALVAAGEELGNHSFDHRRLVFISTSTVRNEIGDHRCRHPRERVHGPHHGSTAVRQEAPFVSVRDGHRRAHDRDVGPRAGLAGHQ